MFSWLVPGFVIRVVHTRLHCGRTKFMPVRFITYYKLSSKLVLSKIVCDFPSIKYNYNTVAVLAVNPLVA